MTYEEYAEIRDKRGKTDYQVSKETGIARSTFSDWKSGRSKPKLSKLEKICVALSVNIKVSGAEQSLLDMYHSTDITEDEFDFVQDIHTYYSPETAKMAQNIYENSELKLLFDAAVDADPEDLKTVHSMLLALKRKERQ